MTIRNLLFALLLSLSFCSSDSSNVSSKEELFDHSPENRLESKLLGQWYRPENLADSISQSSGSSISPQVAMNANGDAVIAWVETDSASIKIYASLYTYSNHLWSAPVCLSCQAQDSFYYFPRVAINDSGHVIIVWGQGSAQHGPQIFKAEYQQQNGWTLPANNSDFFSLSSSQAMQPEVALNNAEEAVIVWLQIDGVYSHVYKAELLGSNWEKPTSIADHISQGNSNCSRPKVAMGQYDGKNPANVLIDWTQYNFFGNEIEIYISEKIGGTWQAPFWINTFVTPFISEASEVDVAMNEHGEWVMAWTQYQSLYVAHRTQASAQIQKPTSYQDFFVPAAFHSSVGIDSKANMIVAYEKQKNNLGRVYAATGSSKGWALPKDNEQISFLGENSHGTQVSMDQDGNAILIWNQLIDNVNRLYKARYNPLTQKWRKPIDMDHKLSFKRTSVFQAPQVTTNNGRAMIVWDQDDIHYLTQIFAAVYY